MFSVCTLGFYGLFSSGPPLFSKCCQSDSSQSNNIQQLINTWPGQVLVTCFKFLNEFQNSAAETFFFSTALRQKQIRQNSSVLLPEARGNYSCFPVNPSISTELQEMQWSNHFLPSEVSSPAFTDKSGAWKFTDLPRTTCKRSSSSRYDVFYKHWYNVHRSKPDHSRCTAQLKEILPESTTILTRAGLLISEKLATS